MKESSKKPTGLIIIGTSAGGIMAMKSILPKLKKKLKAAVILVVHRLKDVESKLLYLFQEYRVLPVVEANDKMFLKDSMVYIAPANYHLLIQNRLFHFLKRR